MLTEYPKFRADLIVSRSRQADEEYFLIKDPVTGKFFRLKETEYFIATRLDGRTPPSKILGMVEREFGVSLAAEKLEQFMERLRGLCLLDLSLSEPELVRQQRRMTREQSPLRSALFIKLKTFDPDAFLDAILPRVRFFFTKGFVILTVALTIIAVAITAARWALYKEQVARLMRPETIVTFVCVALLVAAFHEFAHGLTCKHYGGHVHEMGFLLIYLMPAFYCNVSDAWLFEERGKRIWVSFAGMFIQMFLWALAAIVWRLVDPGTWMGSVCCLTMAASGIANLFNLNPLIKLDGYYMLSDYLAVPNLRKRAFDYLGSRIRERFSPGSRTMKKVTEREGRIYLLYGILAGMYSFFLLAFILLRIAWYAFARFHGTGLIVLVAIVFLGAAGSLERWAAKAYGMLTKESRAHED